MQLFSADATTFSKKNLNIFFASENMKKTSTKVAHKRPKLFFFSIANWHRNSPNHIFCSKKCLPARLLYNAFGFVPFAIFAMKNLSCDFVKTVQVARNEILRKNVLSLKFINMD